MAMIEDDQNNGFSFIWKIHNFSYCVQKPGERLESPRFLLDSSHIESLQRDKNGFPADFACVVSIRTKRDSFKTMFNGGNLHFPGMPYSSETPDFSNNLFSLSPQEIRKKGMDAYLDNDALTIRCRICKVNGNILENKQCYAQTRIGVQRITYHWNSENPSTLPREIQIEPNLLVASFTMSNRISDEGKFEVVIKWTNATRPYFSTCELSLLDNEVVQSIHNERFFDMSNGEQDWTIALTPDNNFLTRLQQNSAISLQCDFSFSSGVEYSKIENIVYGTTVGELERSNTTVDSNTLELWKNNLQCIFSEGKFSDLTIRTPRKEFLVHKAMLCAQSPVFSTMFGNDTRENQTGIVEIEDLEDEIIFKTLTFVYTGTVDIPDWETASKLFFAADKYEMMAFKDKCSFFLKENLNISNVCQCLVLADMHQDQVLKSTAQDFVIKNSVDIINSDEWEELMENNVRLGAETMNEMIKRNLNN